MIAYSKLRKWIKRAQLLIYFSQTKKMCDSAYIKIALEYPLKIFSF